MSENKEIQVQTKSGETVACSICVSEAPPWTIGFRGLGAVDDEFSGADLFEALRSLRLRLEGIGAKLLCAGARRDVYPSAMSRSMSGGRKAYKTVLGRGTTREDLVDIFDPAPADAVGTCEEQSTFHNKWFDSL